MIIVDKASGSRLISEPLVIRHLLHLFIYLYIYSFVMLFVLLHFSCFCYSVEVSLVQIYRYCCYTCSFLFLHKSEHNTFCFGIEQH